MSDWFTLDQIDSDTHVISEYRHWDHIGGHEYYPDFYAHEAELNWLNGGFPLTMDTVRDMVKERCDLPEGYDVSTYRFFQGASQPGHSAGASHPYARRFPPSQSRRQPASRQRHL